MGGSYTKTDFAESLKITGDPPLAEIARVVAAWGIDDDGWQGGFLLALKDGSFAYLTGWCDYTGWGCQDGAEVTRFPERPTLAALVEATPWFTKPSVLDEDPADLNKWIADGMPDEDRWS